MKLFDTETCGLHGPIVLLQYAEGMSGPVKLVSMWKITIREAIRHLENIIYDPEGVIGFNLAFDWFHVCQMYTTLLLMKDWDADLIDCLEEYALNEPKARFGPCVKPVNAFDIMLHARKGPYQSTMDRGDIRIRRVPTALAWKLTDELERRVILKDVYFSRKKNKQRWHVYDIEDKKTGIIDPDFKDVCLKFGASSALKALATDALNLKDVLKYSDIELEGKHYPEELGYAPFATAIGSPSNWNEAWPEKIMEHILHWHYNSAAREYAKLDVVYLQRLYEYFGSPPIGDDDSILACMVGAVRWRGFSIDLEGLKALRDKTQDGDKIDVPPEDVGKYPFADWHPTKKGWKLWKIPTSPIAARNYIEQGMDVTEILVMEGSTKKEMLEQIINKWKMPCTCENGCETCGGTGEVPHPSSAKAQNVLTARQAHYEVDFYNKLLLPKRFHASVKVIGALSGRMSGADGLNPQGVKRTKEVRKNFTFADPGEINCGGDFNAFEVTIAEAVYNDPKLRADIVAKRPCHKCKYVEGHECKGKECKICKNGVCKECGGTGLTGTKIHALFGLCLYPQLTYEQILDSEGKQRDFYERSKRSFFATLYGAEGDKLGKINEIDKEAAERALYLFGKKYPGVGQQQAKLNAMFCSMIQENREGHGKITWKDPSDYVESVLGFRRYFTLENQICKVLYTLAQEPPASWKEVNIKVQRRDRLQLAVNAVRSALFAAAFGLQASNLRAAKNHVIQSTGAQITKNVQRRIWDIQEPGVKPWRVRPLNIHDEIQCPTDPAYTERVATVVKETVESFRSKIPLIKIGWKTGLASWADK